MATPRTRRRHRHHGASKRSDHAHAAKRLPRAEREQQMLEAAGHEFGKKGFAATSMDDIARACGITKPMLYNYFGSKQGLYDAMVQRAGQHLVASVVGVISEADPLTRLRHAIAVFMEFVDQHRDSWRMVFAADGGGNSSVEPYRRQMLEAAVTTLSQLGAAQLSAEKAQAIAAPYAHILLGAVEAAAHWWVSDSDMSLPQAQHMADATLLALAEVVKRELEAVA